MEHGAEPGFKVSGGFYGMALGGQAAQASTQRILPFQ
jgi:hypothetical protein